MITTFINDCTDANAQGRQLSRIASLLPTSVAYVGVKNDLEAAGNLIDVLDAVEDRESLVLVNVAPRHGSAKKWPNGTPFGYFRYQQALVVASIDGLTLSLVKKLRLVDEIRLLDIPTVVAHWVKEGHLSATVGEHLIHTQFRSFDFVPRVGAYLLSNSDLPSTSLSLESITDAPAGVWWVDNFGNAKTTLLVSERRLLPHRFQALSFYERLKDVPNQGAGVIVGSSGIGNHRWLELVLQGDSAAQTFGLSSGLVF